MLADDEVPHDTWIADEDPSEETLEWCKEHINAGTYILLTFLVLYLNRRERENNRRWEENRQTLLASAREVVNT